jgi:hypothetical protein
MCNEDWGPSLELRAIHHDIMVVGVVEDEPLERRNDLVFPDGEIPMESGRVRGEQPSSPDNVHDVRERRGRHRQQVEDPGGVLRKENYVTFDRKIR